MFEPTALASAPVLARMRSRALMKSAMKRRLTVRDEPATRASTRRQPGERRELFLTVLAFSSSG
jgi:hypothetical protein